VSAMLGAMEIGLFRHLRDGPADVRTLAARTGASERAIEILVQVLEPLGYLDRKGERYALSRAGRQLPVDLLDDMVPFLRTQAVIHIGEAGRGIRDAPEGGVFGWERVKDGEVGRGYQATMRWLASGTVDGVVRKIRLPDGPARMLDVGGSHGLYTVAFCRRYPELRGTVLDWAIGLEEAERTLAENPDLADRIDLVERDFETEELPDGYDFAFLGNIIHGVSPEGNRSLFDKLARATTDRGLVAMVDQFAGARGSRFGRATAALIGLNLFLFAGGRAYPVEEVTGWLRDAGFENPALKRLPQPGFSLLVARKGVRPRTLGSGGPETEGDRFR
jgi:hypothetical protein